MVLTSTSDIQQITNATEQVHPIRSDVPMPTPPNGLSLKYITSKAPTGSTARVVINSATCPDHWNPVPGNCQRLKLIGSQENPTISSVSYTHLTLPTKA